MCNVGTHYIVYHYQVLMYWYINVLQPFPMIHIHKYTYIYAYTTHIFVCACQYPRAWAYLHPSRAHTFQALKILQNHCRHRHRAIHCETQGASPFIINGRSIHWNQGWGEDVGVLWIDPSTQAHLGSPCLHSCQRKHVWLWQPILLQAQFMQAGCRHGPCPSPGPG